MFTQQQIFQSWFYYNPETGLLYRSMERNKPVGWLNAKGYIETKLMGRSIVVHRIAWIYTNGDIPEDMVMDHRNGIRSDNRIENLRLATRIENSLNSQINKNNTSGIKGVYWNKQKQMWGVKLRINGKTVYEGCFPTKEGAIFSIRKAREIHCGDFTNHGEAS